MSVGDDRSRGHCDDTDMAIRVVSLSSDSSVRVRRMNLMSVPVSVVVTNHV